MDVTREAQMAGIACRSATLEDEDPWRETSTVHVYDLFNGHHRVAVSHQLLQQASITAVMYAVKRDLPEGARKGNIITRAGDAALQPEEVA